MKTRKETIMLLALELILIIGNAYYTAVSYRFIPPIPEPIVHTICPPSKSTVTVFPNGTKLYQESLFDCIGVTDSLSAVYYSAALAARAEALALVSLILDTFHLSEILTLLAILYVVLRAKLDSKDLRVVIVPNPIAALRHT
jgi:hypothetical protein